MTNDKDPRSPWSRARPGGNPPPKSPPARGAGPRPPLSQDEHKRERARAPIDEPRKRSAPSDARSTEEPVSRATPREQRLYGLNACLAAFAKRPDALRKVYLVEARIPALKAVLAWCVAQRIGYRVVEE